jgi:heme a synthase
MGVVAPARLERFWQWTAAPKLLRGFAIASVVANVVIVVTGGAVRLSDSGLGCPTWPDCQGGSLTPSGPSSYHKVIEFTNRQLTGVLVAVALITMLLAWRQRREIRLAVLALAIIPAQAIIGGISVLTDLNPWVVALHLLTSMANIAVTVVLLWRLRTTAAPPPAGPVAQLLARVSLVVTACVLAAGTVVTGAGPHSGAKHQSQRIAIKPSSVTQLHADLVMVLIGLTVGLIALLYAIRAGRVARQAALVLLGVELAQGVIGYIQYFTGLPPVVVGLHMFGACLVWIAVLYVVLTVRAGGTTDGSAGSAGSARSEQLRDRVDQQADDGADDRAVEPDELQVPTHLKL